LAAHDSKRCGSVTYAGVVRRLLADEASALNIFPLAFKLQNLDSIVTSTSGW
jgi:hypothetical protein